MKKRTKRIAIIVFSLLLIAYLAMSWSLSNLILQPESGLDITKQRIKDKWGTSFDTLMATLPTPEDFSIQSEDDVLIKGKYFKQPDTANCGVIMPHGWTSTWAGMLKYASIFENCGCDLVLYDHRVHGESGGDYPTAGIKEKFDLINVTKWYQAQSGLSKEQIGWLGASWGGGTVLQAGAIYDDVAFIISDAAYQDWFSAVFERAIRENGSWIHLFTPTVMGLVNMRAGVNYKDASPLNAASEIKAPVLLIHSETDEATGSSQGVNISKELNAATSTFHHLDWGGGHTMDVILNKEKYTALVYDFIQEKVGNFGDNCTIPTTDSTDNNL